MFIDSRVISQTFTVYQDLVQNKTKLKKKNLTHLKICHTKPGEMLEPSSSDMLVLNTNIKCVTIFGYIRKSGFKLIHHRMYVLSRFSCASFFSTHQAPLSMGFSRQQNWSMVNLNDEEANVKVLSKWFTVFQVGEPRLYLSRTQYEMVCPHMVCHPFAS